MISYGKIFLLKFLSFCFYCREIKKSFGIKTEFILKKEIKNSPRISFNAAFVKRKTRRVDRNTFNSKPCHNQKPSNKSAKEEKMRQITFSVFFFVSNAFECVSRIKIFLAFPLEMIFPIEVKGKLLTDQTKEISWDLYEISTKSLLDLEFQQSSLLLRDSIEEKNSIR